MTIPVPVLRRLPAASPAARDVMRGLVDDLTKMMTVRLALEREREAEPRHGSPTSSSTTIYRSEWPRAQLEALGAFRAELEQR